MMGPRVALLVAAMVLALAGTIGTIRWLEAGIRPGDLPEGLEYLPSPGVARRLAFGYEHLGADLMWIRTVQYFGKQIERKHSKFPRLRPLLEVTVGLDPHFIEAYRYGALFLGIAGDIPGNLAFLEQGYHRNPGRWELPHDLGRLYFLQLDDYANALRWWTITESLPQAPTYIPRMIARLHAKVGNLETALELWEAMEQDPNTNEFWRTRAREEIERLRAELAKGHRSQ